MPQITSKQQFEATFKKGDMFYWIDTLRGGAPSIVRDSTVVRVYYDVHEKYLNVVHCFQPVGRKIQKEESAVGDLLSSIRGVFTTHEEAVAALIKRRQDVKTDPELLKRLIQEAYSEAMGVPPRIQDDHLACAAV